MAGAASAQSVLERVLGQINGATNQNTLNGTFANIAENIGSSGSVTMYENGGSVLTEAELEALISAETAVTVYDASDNVYYDESSNTVLTQAEYDALSDAEDDAYTLVAGDVVVAVMGDGDVEMFTTATALADNQASWQTTLSNIRNTAETVAVGSIGDGINGSINNTIDGIDAATQQAIASTSVSAIEWNMPTFDFGDMATTALGAVNTGDITLGVNSAIDEASTSTTNAISAVVDQIGGAADTSAIILNVASNMTGVNGSINNTMSEINGSLGNLSTTALGAVNTGTIVSGVDAAVAGIVGSTSGGSAPAAP
jgi:ACT domain-containing protein